MKLYTQCLFNLVPNFIIFNQYAIIFHHEGHIFSTVFKIFYVSTHLRQNNT